MTTEGRQNLSLDEDSRTTRIMDSFISQLTQLHPSLTMDSSLIQRRLQPFFHSFHTPTHPPYALMIRRAIMELNEGSGSTKEAISEFIKREYDDLPWAHVKILGLHLGKLCEVGELVCAEGGRYVLLPDGEETKQCRGIKKGKRGKRRRKHGDGNGKRKVAGESCEGVASLSQEEGTKEQVQVSELHVASTVPSGVVEKEQEQGEQAHNLSIGRDEESEKGGPEVIGEQSQHGEAEAMAQSVDSQIQDSMPHLETIGSSQPTALSRPIDSQQPLLVPISERLPKCLPAAGIGLSLASLHLQVSCLGHSESNLDATAKVSGSFLSSSNVQEYKHDKNPMSVDPEHQHPNCQHRERRPRKCKEVANYQRESLLPSGSLPPAQLPPAQLPPAQLPPQMSCHGHSEGNSDATAEVSGSFLSSSNVQEHKQDKNPMSVNPEHQHLNCQHRERRPRKCKEVANYQRESLLPSGSLPPAQLPPQISCHGHSEGNLDVAAEVSGSLLSSSNVQKHKQDGNPMSGDPEHQHPNHQHRGRKPCNVQEHKQDENPMSVDPKHRHPNHQHRERRPRKCKELADYQRESLLPSGSLSPAQLPLQMSCHGHSQSSLDAAAKVSGSLSSLNVQEKEQDENPVSVDPEHQHPNHQCIGKWPRKCKKIANYQEEELSPSCSSSSAELQLQMSCRGHSENSLDAASKVSGSLFLNVQELEQGENPISVDPEHRHPNHQCKESMPCKCKKAADHQLESLSPTQFRPQISSDIDLGMVLKRKASLTCENFHDERPQHFNQGIPIRNIDKNPIPQGSEQKLPKRPRGRPPKLETGVNCSQESLFPLDDDIQLQQEHQAKQHDQGRGRSRGRPPKTNGNTMQYEEQSRQKDQARQHGRGRGRGRGRPPKLNQNTNNCGAQVRQKVQAQQQHVLVRGRGRPPKLNQNTNQCEEQLQSQDQGLVNSPNSWGNDNQSLEQKQLHVQSFREHHKSESEEVKPPAGLILGSESRFGSGDAYQSNVGSKPEPPTAAATST